MPVAFLFAHSMISEFQSSRVKVWIIGSQHPTFAGREYLIPVEAEDTTITKRAYFLAFVLCAMSLSCIFHNVQAIVMGNGHDPAHLCWVSIDVNWYDCLGVRRDFTDDVLWVDAPMFRI